MMKYELDSDTIGYYIHRVSFITDLRTEAVMADADFLCNKAATLKSVTKQILCFKT